MRISSCFLSAISVLAVFVVQGQPVLRPASPIVNSASYRTAGLPGSGIAQGSIFTIFGNGLGPSPYVQAQTFPLPDALGGTSVSVTVGGQTVPAIILLAYSTQINAILPSTTPLGSGTLTVTYNGRTSPPATIEVVKSAFGSYAYTSSGAGQAIATDTSYAVNTIIRTFHPGDYVILWGTGLGAIAASDATAPPVGNVGDPVQVYVGMTKANVTYQGRSGCCSGLDQIVFQVPPGIQGCHVPVAVQTGTVLSNMTTIAVSTTGQTCTDSVMGQDLVNKLAAGESVSFGYVYLMSLIAPFLQGQTAYAGSDYAYASFSRITPQTAGVAQYGVSAGYCLTSERSPLDLSPHNLDAGSTLRLEGQGAATLNGPYYYFGVLNANVTRFLWSGLNYTLTGGGGKNVGAFSVTEQTGVATVTLTGLQRGQTIPRGSDLTLQWTGGDPKIQNGQVSIFGYSANDELTQLVYFACQVPLSAQKFTIPQWLLSSMPPTGTGHNGTVAYPQGWITIGQYSNPVSFSGDGLTKGIMTDIFFNGLGVYFQ